MKKILTFLFFIFFASTVTFAKTIYASLYVNAASATPAHPYSSWETAATDIQTAIDAASAGDHIIVTNGVYNFGKRITPGFSLSNRVLITKNIILRSVNGPENTIIIGAEAPGGGNGNGAVRCIYMTAGAVYGFTISNGFTHTGSMDFPNNSGGGIWLTNGCVVTNCIAIGNSADYAGGAFFNFGGNVSDCFISGNSATYGGGAFGWQNGVFSSCIISGNSGSSAGGGALSHSDGIVSNCTITGNNAYEGGGIFCQEGGAVVGCSFSGNDATFGGGIFCYDTGFASDCTISGSTALYGGGVYIYNNGVASACKINGNSAEFGGGVYCFNSGALTNCLISGMNSATFGGGVYLSEGGELFNCTIADNFASGSGGGIVCSNGGTVVNTIIYNNTALISGLNWQSHPSNVVFSYCCTTPTNNLPVGNQCIPETPDFDLPGSDYHLQEFSPCVNSGANMPWTIPPATDLDGNLRKYDGAVDIGCYEFIPEPGIVFSIQFSVFCFFILRNKFKF